MNRGHQIIGIAPGIKGASTQKSLTLKAGDIRNPEALAEILKGNDLVVSSVKSVDSAFKTKKLEKAKYKY